MKRDEQNGNVTGQFWRDVIILQFYKRHVKTDWENVKVEENCASAERFLQKKIVNEAFSSREVQPVHTVVRCLTK